MAKATTETTREVIEQRTVTLVLTDQEALTLAVVLGKVGGVQSGPRRHTEAILEALERHAGVKWFDAQMRKHTTGSIVLRDWEA
ncbi:hypothetical protein [Streptomyces ardesiacus]|uniref:hypothetical protein n=1 Tax=Streptomyces ardesiacus TaxID=285564 RepID=UPI0036568B48